ncbi:flagellar filament capping protein FliD [Neobacillus drentensis]|uniref:flagellar filament capping protein FliD n=1 Tax=Neobacillus drentensis TaxID=220684 RepID=UPI003000A923
MIDSSKTLRVSGLASGMNTDEIVANLVKAQSSRLFKMQQNKIMSTWKQDAYRDVNKKVDEFRKSMEALRLQSTFNKQTVTSSDPRIEVSSAGTSTQTNFTISNVVMPKSEKPAMVSLDSKSSNVTSDFSFKLNSTDIALKSGMTLDQAISEINKYSSSTNVKATNVGGSLVFTSMDLSKSIIIESTDTTTFTPIPGNSLGITEMNVSGTPAEPGSININNTLINISSNKFTYEGVAFTLKDNIPTGSVSVQIGSDTQSIFDNIKMFVDKYNELIADLNGRLTEKKYRDYPPLLDDQKKDMKDNDIKLWEEKSKSGLLTSDSTIRSFLTEMRNSLITSVQNQTVSTSYNTLKDIGIDFSKDYRDNGKLALNEEKLKGILQTNLEDVKNLFTIKESSTSSATTVTDSNLHDKSGFGWRIYDRLNLTITQLGTIAGSPNSLVDTKSFMANQLKSINANIDSEREKISTYEQRLWKQFGAMEKALQQLNSQGSWLSQQLGMQ